MDQAYREAFSEVEFIINRLEEEEMKKIPLKFKELISKNKCKWHEINENSELKEETLAILAVIYRKFLAPLEEREELEKEYLIQLKQEKQELKNKKTLVNFDKEINYNFDEINAIKKLSNEPTKVELVEIQNEKWYLKLFNRIRIFLYNRKL